MVDVLASHAHYADHLAPIAALLPPGGDAALVAGYGDLVAARRAGYRRFIMAQHGAGQSYSSEHPHYPGGKDHDDVGLFLTPNQHSANRWRERYPAARVEAVGCPKLDSLPAREPGPGPVVAFAFHWDLYLEPESRSALAWFQEEMKRLAAVSDWEVIGTGHPRRKDLAHVYKWAGIEYVPDFREVCRRADVLAFDNTSVGYEFAATGRPVVVMDAPWYREDVAHGLRFWEAADVGVRVRRPSDLGPALRRALGNHPADIGDREDALETVYAYRYGAARRAADVIADWL